MIHYYICRENEGGEAILAIADNPSFFAESSNQFEAGWHSSIPDIRVEPDGDDTTGTVFVEEITEAEFKNIESFKLVRIASIGEYQLRRIHKSGGGVGGNVQIQGGCAGSSGVGGAITLTAGNGVAGAGGGGSVQITGGCAGGAGGGASSQGGI